MTRISYQSMIGLALVLLFFTSFDVFDTPTFADEKPNVVVQDASAKLIGTWKLEKAENPGSPSGIGTRLKMFSGTHWCVIQPDAAGKIVFLHGGTYEFDGSDLKTTTDFAGDKTSMFIGKAGTVKLEIEGDVLKQIDAKGIYNETWRRVTKPGAK